MGEERTRVLEAKVAERTAELESLLAHARVGFAFFDREGGDLHINGTLAAAHGLPAETHLGKSIPEVVPAIANIVEPCVRQVFETGEAIQGLEVVDKLRESDEECRHWLASVYPMQSPDGTPVSVGTVVVEITAQKRAEQALRESEARLRRLWESNVIGVITSDASGGIRDANDAVLGMLGYTREELQAGRVRWMEMTPPEYLYLDDRGIAEALDRGACTPYEKIYVGKDGRRVPILIGYALTDAVRQEFICFVLDLTEQKRAKEALEEQLLLNRTIADNASAALFMIDARGHCTFINPAAEAMTGYALDDLRLRRLDDVLHRPQDAAPTCPIAAWPLAGPLPAGARVCAHECVLTRKSGETFPALTTASPILHEGRPGV
jgi:PAS domain S-box-containing protein